MKHLLLFRHAKSCWANPALHDFDRPLNKRGRRASVAMADYLVSDMPRPDVVLCSTAQRTRETLAPLLLHYDHEMDIVMCRDLYHADPDIILARVRQVKKEAAVIMVIGHNPGLEDCADLLCDSGERTEMWDKFPTAACAHITFEKEDWTQVGPKDGHLQAFVRPCDVLGQS